MFFAALVSFFSFVLLMSHLSDTTLRRIAGHAGIVDLCLHGAILVMFLGTSTMGLLQAEAAGIMFSLSLRGYRWMFGYERIEGMYWVRYHGWLS